MPTKLQQLLRCKKMILIIGVYLFVDGDWPHSSSTFPIAGTGFWKSLSVLVPIAMCCTSELKTYEYS